MAKVSGLQKHFERLSPRQIQKAAKAGIWAGANKIKVEAQLSITRGSVSGAGHKPSKAGSAPNNDTGVLKNNIETISTGPLSAEVQSKAPYAVIHEYGGTIKHPGGTPYFINSEGKAVFVSNAGQGAFHGLKKTKPHDIKIPERPYMRPASKKMRPEIVKDMKVIFDAVLRRKG